MRISRKDKAVNVLEGSLTEGSTEFPARHVFVKCPACRRIIDEAHLRENLEVCPRCGKYQRISARSRLQMTVDAGSFEEWDADLAPTDFLGFPGYADKLASESRASGELDAVVCGRAAICGNDTAIFCMNADFMMGSMGAVVGEKICRTFERARELALPVVGFTVSGGARMQEGVTSLMQMAKVSAAVRRHSEAGGLYITVLTDPTTGGVTASFAMEGDIILSEPDALVAFAGPRVIEQNMHQRLPKGFQRAEFLLEHGFCDAIVPRGEMALTIGELLSLHAGRIPGAGTPHEIVRTGRLPKRARTRQKGAAHKGALEIVKMTRSADRATAGEIMGLALDGFIELHGDRFFADDGAIVAGIGWMGEIPLTVIAVERGCTTKERVRRNFGMAHPEGYRKARRLMRQAEKFKRPVLCLVDTSGAYCGIGAEERGQGEAIAQNLMEMSGLAVPSVAVVVGEGGSGGALALAVADRVLMLGTSAFSVVSPEACASIIWKDIKRADEAAEALRLTAPELLELGLIDGIIDDAGATHVEVAQSVAGEVRRALGELSQLDPRELVERRYGKYRAVGANRIERRG